MKLIAGKAIPYLLLADAINQRRDGLLIASERRGGAERGNKLLFMVQFTISFHFCNFFSSNSFGWMHK